MNILLTGVISGIGKYLALEMKKEPGTFLIGIDLAAETDLPEEVASVLDEYHRCDLSEPESTERTLRGIISAHPGLDLVIHNAGVKAFGDVTSLETSAMAAALNVNTLTPMIFSKLLFEAYDRILMVIIGSNSSFHAYPMTAVYGATKSAVNALTEGLQGELKAGQRVVAVCPSIVATEEFSGDYPGSTGKFRQPEDVLKAIRRIIEGKEKRSIVPVITLRWKITYSLRGLLKIFRLFLRPG